MLHLDTVNSDNFYFKKNVHVDFLLQHIPAQHQRKFKCKFCDFKGCQEATNKHELNHNRFEFIKDLKCLKCLICSRKFERRGYIMKHMKNIHGYSSTTYNGRILKKTDVTNHSKVGPTENHFKQDRSSKFECEHCEKKFSDKVDLRAHLDIVSQFLFKILNFYLVVL